MREALVATIIAAVILALSVGLASCTDNDPYEEKPSYSYTSGAPQKAVWIVAALEAKYYYTIYKEDGSAVMGKHILVNPFGYFLYESRDSKDGEFIPFGQVEDICAD